MKIKEIEVRSILTKSKLPEADYVINPYIGCQHSCRYCYARFMKRFTGHTEQWGKFLDIKINAPELLDKELKKAKRGTVLLSSVTDPYIPIERKYKLTRKLLEILLKHQFPVSILTKSNLVLRDIDLLKQFKKLEVGITITSLDDSIRKHFEPYSSSVEDRLDTLDKLHLEGIKTYAFIGPILPELTDLDRLYTILEDKVEFIMAENLNVRTNIWKDIESTLKEYYPELIEKYKKIFFTKNDYWKNIKEKLIKLEKEHSIKTKIFFDH